MPSWRTALAAMVIVAIIAVAVVLTVRSSVSAQAVNTDWPSLTMTYEVAGPPVLVGGEEQSGTEVHRLEYTSKDEWTDTIIEAPDIATTVGTFNSSGSFRSLNGGVITEYDAITGSTSTEETIEGSYHVAGPMFVRYSINVLKKKGYDFSQVPTDARVCFRSVCEDNATGVRIAHSGQERVFVNDVRGIPLEGGASFRVREVRIDDGKQAVAMD